MSPINDMCRQDNDVSLSHNFKEKSHYVKNGRHGLQNGGYIGMMYSTILFLESTPHKTYIESTLKALRLLVSEIDVLLWKWPPFCKMASQCQIEWCGTFRNTFSEIYASQNLYNYTVNVEGSAPLRF